MGIRVLTTNLYNGRADLGSLSSALELHKPDVVAAQELAPNAAEVLEDWASSHLLDPRRDLTGMGIAVRGPAEFSRLEFPNRDPVVALLPGDKWGFPVDVEILNAHLVNPITRPIRRSRRLRSGELASLERVLKSRVDSMGRLLVGDLNSSPAWPMYRRLRSLATDAALAAGTAGRSWGPRPGWPRLLRIDHAFVQGLVPVRTALVSIDGADHSGLLVDVEF